MNKWKVERVDNFNDALNATRTSHQVATVQHRSQIDTIVYIAHKNLSSIIIEDDDTGVAPEVQEAFGEIYVGSSSGIVCFDRLLQSKRHIPIDTPFVKFLCSTEHFTMIAVCEADIYFIHPSFVLTNHTPLNDMVNDCFLCGDKILVNLFEGTQLEIKIS